MWKKPVRKSELWITNTSQKRNISIDDLGLRLNPLQSINLFSGRFPMITKMDIKRSIEAGSIHHKGKWIKIRVEEPPRLIPPGLYVSDKPRKFDLKNPKPNEPKKEYEELDGIDEADTTWASEEAEIAEADRTPLLSPETNSKGDKE